MYINFNFGVYHLTYDIPRYESMETKAPSYQKMMVASFSYSDIELAKKTKAKVRTH